MSFGGPQAQTDTRGSPEIAMVFSSSTWRYQSLLGAGSRHCYGINYTHKSRTPFLGSLLGSIPVRYAGDARSCRATNAGGKGIGKPTLAKMGCAAGV